VKLTKAGAALPAWLDRVPGCRIGRLCICKWFAQIPALVAAVCLVQSVEDCPKLVRGIEGCRITPRCARPECDPGANQRDANCN
jgi:hypothetical protein